MLRCFTRYLRQHAHARYALRQVRALQASRPSLGELVDAAMHFRGRGKIHIRTIQKRSEILGLLQAVAGIAPKRILEIGTYQAGTLLLWSQVASESVVTCDLEQPAIRRRLYEQFSPPESRCVVLPLEGNTHEESFRQRVADATGGLVDFLFIDGDHSESGVERDYEMYHELVRPGGLIAFHDIVERQPVAGNEVSHFWERLKKRLPAGSCREFIDAPDQIGYGIGLVHTAGVEQAEVSPLNQTPLHRRNATD